MTVRTSTGDSLPLLAKPIRSVQELLEVDFASDPDPLNRSRRKWIWTTESVNKLQTLVCHDMRGGYTDDANPQGAIVKEGNAYAPWFWPLVDIFVYFSHARVTIPPLGWIETCHRNDIPCLGTLIFEWNAGSNDIKHLLKNPELCIKQLVSAMVYYGFDGYLLNFECELGTVLTPEQLLNFVSELSAAAHKAVTWSKIICYDCIDKEGHLAYQCELNDANSLFFDASDGILIDYHWKPEQPTLSVSFAGNRSKQIFMGIDVFGRGTFGGGGYNIASAIRHCFQAGASVAIFAPGWAYESAGGFSKGREACLRIEARIWTEARYTVIEPKPNAWNSVKLLDGKTSFERTQEVDLLDVWDGEHVYPNLLDSIPPVSVFHRKGSQLHIDFLTEKDDIVGSLPTSPTTRHKEIEGFVGYGKGVRKLLWKEQSSVQHDEIPAVWIGRPPLADMPPILRPKPIRFALPFMSNFSQGCGKSVYKSGKRLSDTPWYQLLQQDRPSAFLFDSTLFPDCHSGVRVKWDRSVAFEAGNCISCEMGPFANATLPLFYFYSDDSKSKTEAVKLSVTVIPGPDTSQQSLGVHFADGRSISLMLECNFWKDWLARFDWLSDSQKETVSLIAQNVFPNPNLFEKELHQIDLGAVAHAFTIWRAGRLFPTEIEERDSEWITLKFELDASPIVSIEWQLKSGESPSVFHLGQIITAESWKPPTFSSSLTLNKVIVNGSESMLVKWEDWDSESIAWCDIYLSNHWIGRSFTNAFVVEQSVLEKSASDKRTITVQPTGNNGVSIALNSAPCIKY